MKKLKFSTIKIQPVLGIGYWKHIYEQEKCGVDGVAHNIMLLCFVMQFGFLINPFIWTGSSDLANKLFGEKYGADWEYLPGSLDIIVNGETIKIGDKIK